MPNEERVKVPRVPIPEHTSDYLDDACKPLLNEYMKSGAKQPENYGEMLEPGDAWVSARFAVPRS